MDSKLTNAQREQVDRLLRQEYYRMLINFRRRSRRLFSFISDLKDPYDGKPGIDPSLFESLELVGHMLREFIRKYHKRTISTERVHSLRGKDPDELELLLEVLKDRLSDRKREICRLEGEMLMEVISIYDSIARIKGWLDKMAEEEPLPQAEAGLLDNLTVHLEIMDDGLRRRKVTPVSLSPGEYPEPQLTRILHREDDGHHNNFVISKIIEKGYFWRDDLLRKEAVTVISSNTSGA